MACAWPISMATAGWTSPRAGKRPASWRTEPIPALADKQQWMYALPIDTDGRHGIDIVVGSKGDGASVGWLESPAVAREMSAWKYHRLRDAGWIMSLVAEDIDADG